MNHPLRIALALPQGPQTRWRADLAADLAARFSDLVVFAPPDSRAPRDDLPAPARALYAPQALFSRKSRDPLARLAPDKTLAASPGRPLAQADPARFDILVWAGRGDPFAGPAWELARALPLGMLALEPPTLSSYFPGQVPGRLLWKRGPTPARLALETVTCLPGPFLGSFVRAHFAKASRMPGRALDRIAREGEAFWDACPEAPGAANAWPDGEANAWSFGGASSGTPDETLLGEAATGPPEGTSGKTSGGPDSPGPDVPYHGAGEPCGGAGSVSSPGPVTGPCVGASSTPASRPNFGKLSGLGPWARALAALAVCSARRAWQDLACRRQWLLAERAATSGPDAPDFATRPFTPVPLPETMGQADPFLFVHQGRTWCFLEEIPPSGRGVIAVRERLPDGTWSPSRRVLEEPFHLSYPFVFAHEGQVYMIPETGQAGRVGLYRATDFPGGWAFERELLSGVTAVDATLLEHDGLWWMFVNLRPPGGSSWDELHLHSAPGPLGPFTPHPQNPVVSDVRRARPAGRIFRHAGRLYRPGQDSSCWYGRGLALMEITRLDQQGYAERPAARLDASLIPGSFCLHTYQAGPGFEMVDGQRFRPVWERKKDRKE